VRQLLNGPKGLAARQIRIEADRDRSSDSAAGSPAGPLSPKSSQQSTSCSSLRLVAPFSSPSSPALARHRTLPRGRTIGASGIPSRSNVFFIGVNNGGVWKTGDSGRTSNPVQATEPRHGKRRVA
jgi:hypothetical protein